MSTFNRRDFIKAGGAVTAGMLFLPACTSGIKEGASYRFFTNNEGACVIALCEQIIPAGENFGGVSVLMNAGISVRTVITVEDTTLYTLPQKAFLEICGRHNFFYDFFAARFHRQMSDKSYASLVVSGQALHFLSQLVPFSFLPEEEINRIVDAIQMVHYPRNHVLFVQGQSKIESLYIIQKGAAERYYEEKNKKTLRGLLAEGDMYGGISLLMNDGIPIRTLRVTEDSHFFIIPKDLFFDICKK